jgi:hypothetical protein
VPGAILRMGDPRALGAIGGLVAMLVAMIAGCWNTRALKRASAETSGQGPRKRLASAEGKHIRYKGRRKIPPLRSG